MRDNNPKHIAIVLDGNRRFAKKQGLEAWKGHSFGVRKVEDLLEWCRDLGVNELTLYSFSADNFKRPEREKKTLFELFRKNFDKLEKDGRLMKNGIKVRFIGRTEMFPRDIQEKMHRLMEKTKGNDKFKVNFAMAYSGKAEITDSVKKIANKIKNGKIEPKDINEKIIENSLYLNSEPDIFIRPGGEKRMSDFLLWQSSYAEIFFIETLWPEFTKEELIKILEEFKQRERRFGR